MITRRQFLKSTVVALCAVPVVASASVDDSRLCTTEDVKKICEDARKTFQYTAICDIDLCACYVGGVVNYRHDIVVRGQYPKKAIGQSKYVVDIGAISWRGLTVYEVKREVMAKCNSICHDALAYSQTWKHYSFTYRPVSNDRVISHQ